MPYWIHQVLAVPREFTTPVTWAELVVIVSTPVVDAAGGGGGGGVPTA